MNSINRLFIYVATTTAAWALGIVLILHIATQEEKTNHLIDEISTSINKLQQTLFLAQPYRSQFSVQIELDIQLLHAQALQLKALNQSELLSDVTHTVYLLERFVEQATLLAKDETRLDEFIANISEKTPSLTLAGRTLSNELSSIVLDTLFNESIEPRHVYLKLEEVQRLSYQLPEPDRQQLLSLNSQASVLLSRAANTNFLVERVVNHPVIRELSQRKGQSQQVVNQQLFMVSLLSLILVGTLTLLGWRYSRSYRHSFSSLDEVDGSRLIPQAGTEPSQIPQPVDLSEGNTKYRDTVTQTTTAGVAAESAPPAFQPPSLSESVGRAIHFEKMLSTLDGDHESMLLLLGVFVAEHANDAEKLQHHLVDDVELATRIAHTLKGVSGSIFAEQLRNVAIATEHSLKETQSVSNDVLEELARHLAAAITSAEDYIANPTLSSSTING
ncbi:Hpt domain-containing protein [Vibrio hangzhouensis]|uniref:HPt (Histidine-containing phosphotransfer) domain-containing protein n=1 Tax=Vibrio hangzhouensis TaxID=462991 RepID=A0A1H5Z7G1_9VIBR|nr:Hpt domain-containing protein [Vibrio hangzhouensis]SEG32222.1 HPt (histidine-containing phosphotransfer) domain-containing protein [Vibrio hangzhouensis]